MNNFVVLPLLIPLLAGLFMIIFRKNTILQRWLSVISFVLTTLVALYLLRQVFNQGIQIVNLGGWQAPFGIVFVVDMLSALLLVTTGIVSTLCVLYAFNSIGKEREGFYFYPLLQFLIVGVNGSFLTGDIFNLFVCFEVMLLSSYVLLSLGGTKLQLKETIKYVLINTLSSTLFVVAIAYLYAVVGTLNMAHLSVRVAEAGQTGFLTVVAIFFLIVFSLKAALFLYFWLPGAYSAPPPVIAAIFGALLTKVGIYALFRMFTLIFYHQPEITHILLGILAALTMVLGGLGAIAQKDIRYILSYNVIIGVGFIISGLAIFTPKAVIGAVYYLIHDMAMKALLFLLGGAIMTIVGSGKLKEMGGLIRNHPLLGWMFLIATLSLAGIPPLSGFVGKVLIIEEGLAKGGTNASFYWLAALGLFSSFLVLYSLLKIFINGFWGETLLSEDMEKGSTKGLLLPCALLVAIGIFLGVGAEWIYPYIEQAATSMLNPNIYIEAVLGEVI
ncbi:MAG: Na+/H+ antiporter subunit D [Clostridia bacterium]|jgi:multicomponent Na+:H+ antiporter subunit D|nr:Na+/H+ antiporter subunit D [Clostridia bacterium]